MTEVDVLVVGAGPCGLSAASSAAEAGASVLVADEAPILGGQYLRPRFPRPVSHPVVERFLASGAGLALEQAVWNVDATAGRAATSTLDIRFHSLVIATGAFDRPVTAAGSHKPGVITLGAAQALAKDGVVLGEAVLVAGTGPFVLPVSHALTGTGSAISEIALTHLPRMSAAAVHAPQTVPEAWRYTRNLMRHRIPVRTGWVLSEVLGDERVTGAVLVGAPGGPRAGRTREVECDLIAAGYGFLPQLAIADLAGCRLRFDARQGTWFVQVDRKLETSVPGVFAAGEVTGIGGHRKAIAEGIVAGYTAAAHAGHDARVPAAAEARLRRYRRFTRAARHALAPPDLAATIPDQAIVCRCEGVSAATIRAAARDGATTVAGVRMRTRCGMGVCQGRMCAQLTAELTDNALEAPAGLAGRLTSRVPARPVTVGDLAR
jgi:NADPH-dependent 2,4-dienoyl-CoA reductase/sulfur reductase-like enzyme